jgi:Flp pilus assembly protein TadG
MPGMRKLTRDERGDSLVEFAVSAIILFTVIFGIMDFSRALFIYHFASYAAQEGTRYAVVRGSYWSGTSCASTTSSNCEATSSEITTFVKDMAPAAVSSGSITVTPSWPGKLPNGSTGSCSTTASTDGCLVKVEVQVTFSFILPFLPKNSMTFVGTSEGVVQR